MHPNAPKDKRGQTVCDSGRGRKRLDVSRVCGESGGTQFTGLLKKAEVNLDKVSDVFVKEETGTD